VTGASSRPGRTSSSSFSLRGRSPTAS
jgi:hypothetical protein